MKLADKVIAWMDAEEMQLTPEQKRDRLYVKEFEEVKELAQAERSIVVMFCLIVILALMILPFTYLTEILWHG